MKVSRIVLSYLLGFVVSILKLTISPMAATEPPRTIPKPTLQSGKKVAIRIRRPDKGLLTTRLKISIYKREPIFSKIVKGWQLQQLTIDENLSKLLIIVFNSQMIQVRSISKKSTLLCNVR